MIFLCFYMCFLSINKIVSKILEFNFTYTIIKIKLNYFLRSINKKSYINVKTYFEYYCIDFFLPNKESIIIHINYF